jgi:putative peptidoglycan lipid II flippase
MFCIHLVFLIRDNLASRLAAGAVTSLTYGWMIQQVPETLIGTAIGTALLPTLSEHFAREDRQAFTETVQKAVKVLLALTLPVAGVLSFGLQPLLGLAFDFGEQGTALLSWVTAAFMVGLLGHSLKEISARSFYARQNAWIPLITAASNVVLYILSGSILYRVLGAPGIALTDSIVFTLEAIVLLILLSKIGGIRISLGSTWLRALLALLTASLVTWGSLHLMVNKFPVLVSGTVPMLLGFVVCLPWIWREIKLLARL